MTATHCATTDLPCDLEPPRRNRYFYGKLLDAYHFELETNYHRYKRSLLNRLVTGCGVVCGLDVERASEHSIIVGPGFAIDRHGKEIIVDAPSREVELLPPPVSTEGQPGGGSGGSVRRRGHCDDYALHIVLCYHECATEPAPAMTSSCEEEAPCQPGAILERYRIDVRPGMAEACGERVIADCVSSGKLDYRTLATIVTQSACGPCPDDPCIPLANVVIHVDEDEDEDTKEVTWAIEDIDITVRPIVYTNDLLYQLLLCHVEEASYRRK